MNEHDELLARLDDWKTHTPTPTGISVIKSDVANAAAAIRALQAQLLNEKIMREAAERKAYESANAFVEFRRTTYYLAIEHAEAAERQLAELREAVMVYLKAKCTESDHRRQSHYPSAPHETRRQYARLVPGDMDVTAAAEAALRKLVEDK